jgi:hypothetical protein
MPNRNGLHVPADVVREVEQYVSEYRAAHNRFFPPTHEHAGADSDRASVGLPGHCDICAIVGHVVAHPVFGCGDVQCNSDH